MRLLVAAGPDGKGIEMYRIEHIGPDRRARLIADTALSETEFRRIAEELGVEPSHARKFAAVAARRADRAMRLETRWNGKETECEVSPGDWIVTALSREGVPLTDPEGALNVYAIKPKQFAELYRKDPAGQVTVHGALFAPRGSVDAIRFRGGFEILAPWGEVQRADDGWLLLNGCQVYGNHRDTFEATYALLD